MTSLTRSWLCQFENSEVEAEPEVQVLSLFPNAQKGTGMPIVTFECDICIHP
jgi:hypothetical protein